LYRSEAKFVTVKHHWWWKANFVFDHITALKQHRGQKLFIEEDHYLSPDALHVLKLVGSGIGSRGKA